MNSTSMTAGLKWLKKPRPPRDFILVQVTMYYEMNEQF